MEETKKMFEDYKPNKVIHLAANVGGLFKNMNQKVDMLEKNLMINYNVIKCAHDYKIEKLVACLSTCIFPDKIEEYPITEEMLHNGPPHFSNDAYAYSKRMLEIHCRAYRENFGDNFICVSPTNIYGPYDNFDLENGHVLPVLIHRCFLAKQANQDFIVRGTGKPLRQFIFSQDLAQLILLVLDKSNDENTILSSPEEAEVSIKDVATIIAKCFDYEDRIVFDSGYSDGQYKKTVSNRRILELIEREKPDFEFLSIEKGIKQTVKWFQNKTQTKNQ
jgi:GDP-L-fucose synthase